MAWKADPARNAGVKSWLFAMLLHFFLWIFFSFSKRQFIAGKCENISDLFILPSITSPLLRWNLPGSYSFMFVWVFDVVAISRKTLALRVRKAAGTWMAEAAEPLRCLNNFQCIITSFFITALEFIKKKNASLNWLFTEIFCPAPTTGLHVNKWSSKSDPWFWNPLVACQDWGIGL